MQFRSKHSSQLKTRNYSPIPMNIVQMILKLLSSGDNLNKIASALGIGQEQAGKALSAAVPTLLAALAGVASKPGGGADLANAVAKQDSGVLDNLSSLFLRWQGCCCPTGLQYPRLAPWRAWWERHGPNRKRALALYRSERGCH